MGTDIYGVFEKKNKETGLWDEVANLDFEVGRNYLLFSVLADVRNGVGFAGCDTGNPITPIAYPKGLPTDSVVDQNGLLDDLYSTSWLTLNELLDYDWDQKIVQRGSVEFRWLCKNIHKLDNAIPDSWWEFVFGKNIITINRDKALELYKTIPEEVQDYINNSDVEKESYFVSIDNVFNVGKYGDKNIPNELRDYDILRVYVTHEWVDALRYQVYPTIENTINTMIELSESEDKDDVRIVFGFDC